VESSFQSTILTCTTLIGCRTEVIQELLREADAFGNNRATVTLLDSVANPPMGDFRQWQFTALAGFARTVSIRGARRSLRLRKEIANRKGPWINSPTFFAAARTAVSTHIDARGSGSSGAAARSRSDAGGAGQQCGRGWGLVIWFRSTNAEKSPRPLGRLPGDYALYGGYGEAGVKYRVSAL